MHIRRRDFIKASAAAGALLTVGCSPKMNALQPAAGTAAHEMGEVPGEWVASTCQGCTTWCPIEIFVQNGRAVKVRGNQYSLANSGYCCPRGHLLLQQLYDPDRIKVPMKRTNPKKARGEDPRFVPISWDEAMDAIADKIMELRNNQETHKYLLMRGRYSDHNYLLYDYLTKLIGSPNNISHSSICAEVEKFGAYYTQGYWGYRDYDLDKMKYLIVWGCDPISSNRQVPNAIRKLNNLLANGKVIAIDPRMSNTAAKAHRWLPIKPSEDGALATAMAHVILTGGNWHKEFVGDFKDGQNRFIAGQTVNEEDFRENLTNGLVKWWNLEIKDRTPSWAAGITGIDEMTIIEVARGLAAAAPHCGVWYGPHMQPRGSYAVFAIHALNGLVGAVDNEGGVITYQSSPYSSLPKFDDYQDELAKAGTKNKKIDQRGTLAFPALNKKSGGGVVTNNVANGILAEDPYDIKMAVGYFNNFNFAGTEAKRWDQALAKIPFFVHIVPMLAEMSQFADIVLPSTLHHSEQWAIIRSAANTYGHTSIQQPVVKPLFEAKAPETEYVWLLAEKLKAKGFPNIYEYLHNEFADPETGKKPQNSVEFSLFATKIRSRKAWDPKENADYKGDRVEGWEAFRQRGVINSPAFKPRTLWEKGFPTETKKFEFYSETLKKVLIEHAEKHKVSVDEVLKVTNYEVSGERAFVPHYEPPLRHGDRTTYPFDLIDMKSRFNREGRSANLPWYYTFKKCDPGDLVEDDVIQLNPADAARLGIQEGDRVQVSSVIGSLIVRARLWEGVQPGTAAKCYGQGHWAYGRVAARDFKKFEPRGANFNEIMPDEYDRLTGSTARNGGYTGVSIKKI